VLLDDLATYLAAQSTALTVLTGSGGNLAKAIQLENDYWPDTVISLYEKPGSGTVFTMSTSTSKADRAWLIHSVQALSRSTSYETARTKAGAVDGLLDGLSGHLPTSSGTKILAASADQPPYHLGRDKNERHLVTQNFTIWREAT